MKKNIFKGIIVLLMTIFAITLVGCGEKEDPKDVLDNLAKIKEWVTQNVGCYITENLVLPTTHPELGGTITWSSTDTDILTDDGKIVERGTRAQVCDLAFIIDLNGQLDSDYLSIHVSPITLEEAVEKFEKGLPSKMEGSKKVYFISRDITIPSDYYGIIQVDVDSSNKEIFTNEGKYIKPLADTSLTLKVEFSDSYNKINREYEMSVLGKTNLEVIQEGIDWLDANFVDMLLTEETGLPTQAGNGCTITWKSTNNEVVDSEGHVKEYIFPRYVSLTAKVSNDGDFKTKDYFCKVKAFDSSKMSDDEKLAKFIEAITPSTLYKMSFEGGYGTNITQSSGILCFFGDASLPVITREIIATNLGNKPNENRVSTNLITVHDTGNAKPGADAKMHSNYINNGSGGAETSWHYSVGDDAIYQQIEDDEIAWHAGDGSRTFKLIDTGVKATAKMPLMTFSSDGYFVFGGVKSSIKVPSNAKNYRTGPYGIYTVIGENGNYWMNNAYYNDTYGYICNQGGNRNSVSMETCIDQGSDYVATFYNIARLVTRLIRKYNLTPDEVMQHNNFSGKDCPTVIRATNHWADLKDLISTMQYGLDTFGDYKFTWTVKDSTMINPDGLIKIKAGIGDKLEYSVKVTKNNNTVLESDFVTTLTKR